jgi:hypothetical protein
MGNQGRDHSNAAYDRAPLFITVNLDLDQIWMVCGPQHPHVQLATFQLLEQLETRKGIAFAGAHVCTAQMKVRGKPDVQVKLACPAISPVHVPSLHTPFVVVFTRQMDPSGLLV